MYCVIIAVSGSLRPPCFIHCCYPRSTRRCSTCMCSIMRRKMIVTGRESDCGTNSQIWHSCRTSELTSKLLFYSILSLIFYALSQYQSASRRGSRGAYPARTPFIFGRQKIFKNSFTLICNFTHERLCKISVSGSLIVSSTQFH